MSLSDLKTYFRTVIKVLAGGPPVGTVGSNRAAGVLAALDKLAEFAQAQAGVTAADLAVVATTLPLARAHTADYTLQPSDIGALLPVAGSAPVVVLIPTGLGNAAPANGAVGAAKVCYPLQVGSGQLSVAAAAGVNLLTPPAGGLRATGPGGRLILIWLDTNTVLVEGGI